MQEPSWKATRLWTALRQRPTAPLRYVEACMDELTPLLESGGSAPDITLHDDAHAFRVAERMADIVGEERLVGLSDLDLTMLLVSASAHDIGMAPRVGLVNAIHDSLLTGERDALAEDEAQELEIWLDNEHDGHSEPLEGIAGLRRVRGMTTLYARHRHNAWSAAWIDARLRGHEPLSGEIGFTDDLIAVCSSHHAGYDELRRDRFDPRLAGNPVAILHPRFCAAVLRVADVLDLDPARTPPVLFEHRDVQDGSVIYWLKDQYVKLQQSGPQLVLNARPPDATIHRAIEQTVAGIEQELRLCRRLADETDFERVPVGRREAYAWTLETAMRVDVKPRDDAYEYMDGTFRPDTRKVLDLLGGLALYGNPFAGVRELVQNAFDAVREQIARERLREPDPGAEETAERVRARHQVTLTLEERDGGMVLTCSDTGAGMTRELIRDRLLVGGASKRHEDRALERDCRAHDFEVGRTAQFGIGVLSYFMIASRLEIHTRRGEGADGDGWRFTTRGFDDFGELRRARRSDRGTDVVLFLRRGGAGNGARLQAYLDDEIRQSPCRFRFTHPGAPPLEIEPGWRPFPDLVERALRHWVGDVRDRRGVPTRKTREALARSTRRRERVMQSGIQAAAYVVSTGELPDALGSFRITLPYFHSDAGPCLALVGPCLHRDVGLPESSAGSWRPPGELVTSWNGMHVRSVSGASFDADREFVFLAARVEIDWRDSRAGRLAVDRGEIDLSRSAGAALAWLRDHIAALAADFAEEHRGADCAFLNFRLAGTATRSLVTKWPEIDSTTDDVIWRPFTFPATDEAYCEGPSLVWRARRVDRIRGLGSIFDRYSAGSLPPFGQRPAAITASLGHDRLELVPVWDGLPSEPLRGGNARCAFPEGWERVIGARIEATKRTEFFWNEVHPLALAHEPEPVSEEEAFSHQLADHWSPGEITSSAESTAGWVAMILRRHDWNAWNGLAEEQPQLLQRIGELLDAADGSIGFWSSGRRWWEVRVDGVRLLELPWSPGSKRVPKAG